MDSLEDAGGQQPGQTSSQFLPPDDGSSGWTPAEGYDPENVLDCTMPALGPQGDTEDGGCQVKLKNALDVTKLLNQEGQDFIPEIDEHLTGDLLGGGGGDKKDNFFQNLIGADEETVARAVDGLDLNLEDFGEDEDDCASFVDLGKNMTNVTADGGVKKKVIKPGLEMEGLVPARGTVTIHYKMFVEGQDESFDSTWMRMKPERFQMDDNQLVPGMEIALKSMKKRERSHFLIDPSYAYGAMGCPPRIPGGAHIMAEIELLDFVSEGKADAMLALPPAERSRKHTYDEVEKVCGHEHREGNAMHAKGEYKLAARRFERAIRLLDDAELRNDEEERRQQRLLLKLNLNLGLCYIKFQWFKKACLALQSALDIDPNSAKGLYRLGKAKRELANYDEARKYFIKAQSVSDDPEIGRQLAALDKQLRDDQRNQRALCQRMFGGNGSRGGRMPIGGEIVAADEDYEEIYHQLKCFRDDKNEVELVLPEGMSAADIRVAQHVVTKMSGLELVPVQKGNRERQWIVRRSS